MIKSSGIINFRHSDMGIMLVKEELHKRGMVPLLVKPICIKIGVDVELYQDEELGNHILWFINKCSGICESNS